MRRKNTKNSKKQNLNLPCTGNYLHCIYNYLHSIYVVLGIISNLEMIENIGEVVRRIYANYVLLYKGLEHPWILVSEKVLEPIPHGY